MNLLKNKETQFYCVCNGQTNINEAGDFITGHTFSLFYCFRGEVVISLLLHSGSGRNRDRKATGDLSSVVRYRIVSKCMAKHVWLSNGNDGDS